MKRSEQTLEWRKFWIFPLSYSFYVIFDLRDSLALPRLSKHFTAALDSVSASNKRSWESFYFSENSDNAAWTRSEQRRRGSGGKNANWLWNRKESTSSDRPCKNSWRCWKAYLPEKWTCLWKKIKWRQQVKYKRRFAAWWRERNIVNGTRK